MMQNTSYIVAVISQVGKEYIMTNGIKKPIVKALCSDSNSKYSEISIVFSEICQIKKASSLNVGDIVFFSARIAECPQDNYVFYPISIFTVRKNSSTFEEASQKFIESRLMPYEKERNIVIFGGNVIEVVGDKVCIQCKNENILRGDIEETYHIWVLKDNLLEIERGNEVVFIGEVSNSILKGNVFLCDNKFEIKGESKNEE